MFRENVLVDEQVIRRVSETMVPVAVDYQKVLDRTSRESKFLLPLMKQRDQDQGMWIFAPHGKALGGFVGFGDMLGRTKQEIEAALTAFGPVEPRRAEKVETHPYRGKGFRPDGGVCLAEYVRRKDASNFRSPVISSVVLSAEEFRVFAPPKPNREEKWSLPEPVAKKLCRVASPMCYQHAPQPNWVNSVAIRAKVRAVRGGMAELTYEGTMQSERVMRDGRILSTQDLSVEGHGVYDIGAKKMQSVLIVGSGTFRWPLEAPDQPVPFDALVEWNAEAADGASPAAKN